MCHVGPSIRVLWHRDGRSAEECKSFEMPCRSKGKWLMPGVPSTSKILSADNGFVLHELDVAGHEGDGEWLLRL